MYRGAAEWLPSRVAWQNLVHFVCLLPCCCLCWSVLGSSVLAPSLPDAMHASTLPAVWVGCCAVGALSHCNQHVLRYPCCISVLTYLLPSLIGDRRDCVSCCMSCPAGLLHLWRSCISHQVPCWQMQHSRAGSTRCSSRAQTPSHNRPRRRQAAAVSACLQHLRQHLQQLQAPLMLPVSAGACPPH